MCHTRCCFSTLPGNSPRKLLQYGQIPIVIPLLNLLIDFGLRIADRLLEPSPYSAIRSLEPRETKITAMGLWEKAPGPAVNDEHYIGVVYGHTTL